MTLSLYLQHALPLRTQNSIGGDSLRISSIIMPRAPSLNIKSCSRLTSECACL